MPIEVKKIGDTTIIDKNNIPPAIASFQAVKRNALEDAIGDIKKTAVQIWKNDGRAPGSVQPTQWDLKDTSVDIKRKRGAPRPEKPMQGVESALINALETEVNQENTKAFLRFSEKSHPDAGGIDIPTIAAAMEFGLKPTTQGPQPGDPGSATTRPAWAWFTKTAEASNNTVLLQTREKVWAALDQWQTKEAPDVSIL
jgi:hypothetical protein